MCRLGQELGKTSAIRLRSGGNVHASVLTMRLTQLCPANPLGERTPGSKDKLRGEEDGEGKGAWSRLFQAFR